MSDLSRRGSDDIEKMVSRRASELRADKTFDPRKEKELNDLYNQYIPPHSLESTTHLVDVAERDAYIDPFPPIGSQKMAGAVIKKSVRVAIGWYIQYIAQQISTFGSGVSQALRSLHHEVEDVKKTVSSSNVSNLFESLDLGTIDQEIWSEILTKLEIPQTGRSVVADAVQTEFIESLGPSVIVVDPRPDICSELGPSIDSRVLDFFSFVKNIEDHSLCSIVLHGRSDFLGASQRVELVNHCARVLKDDGKLIFIVRTSEVACVGEQAKIAYELSGVSFWSDDTWKYLLSRSFDGCEKLDVNKEGLSVFISANSSYSD